LEREIHRIEVVNKNYPALEDVSLNVQHYLCVE
jgi:hypothetical protein